MAMIYKKKKICKQKKKEKDPKKEVVSKWLQIEKKKIHRKKIQIIKNGS